MALPNIHFQDFPIEFKEINSNDFPLSFINNGTESIVTIGFDVNEKIIIEPDDRGYIFDALKDNINLAEKNTVVVNAAVGQGKTHSIIQIAKKYYLDRSQEYLIFIASPFVSLVEQYYNDIICPEIPKEEIYRYEYIGDFKKNIDYLTKKIHIITVNGLLGNPGEDAFLNSEAKRKYLNELSKHCKEKNKKVIFIYDEIHDAIHNFKEEFIFNLWKWKDVIHKNFIISATYNEASKIVIQYLAELTDCKIQIIESKRTRFPKNQSNLFLHYNPALYYKNDNEHIRALVKDIIDSGKEIDILSFSKTLADNIIADKNIGIGKELYSKYAEINNCTSSLIVNQREGKLEIDNRFNNLKCNVGTNFKTGVSITKRNHSYLIIMPPKGSKMPFKNLNGIFNGGVISVIQALARQRKKGGDIHIVLPPPDSFDYKTLPFDDELKIKFAEFYELIKDHSTTKELVEYIPLNLQNLLLRSFYEDDYKANLLPEIEAVKASERTNFARLEFPEFKLFQLEYGEDYLASTYKFFGKDLSAYITYCAITNQFINCNLKGITYKPTIFFADGLIQNQLNYFYNTYINDENYFGVYSNATDFAFYLELKNDMFQSYRLKHKIDEKNYKTISIHKNKIFESQLIGFAQRKQYPNSNFTKANYVKSKGFKDYEFKRKDYFSFGIVHAERLDLEDFIADELTTNRIIAFRSYNYFRNKLIASIQVGNVSTRGDFNYLFATPTGNFITESELTKFEQMINYFVRDDYFIKNNIFEFQQRFKTGTTTKQKIKAFYTKLLEDTFDLEDYKMPTPPRRKVKIINQIYDLPNSEDVLDFISPADIVLPDAYWENHTYEVVDGTFIKTTN